MRAVLGHRLFRHAAAVHIAWVRFVHLASAVIWPTAAVLGAWRARGLHRRRTRRRVYLLMLVGLAVGTENLVMALTSAHPHSLAHFLSEAALAALGAFALYLIAAYGDELVHEERVLYALSGGPPGDGESARRPPRPLSPRELEVLALLCQGLHTDEIAEMLKLSPHTVSTHIRNLMGKLEVRTRAEAVGWAVRSGMFDPVTGRGVAEVSPSLPSAG